MPGRVSVGIGCPGCMPGCTGGCPGNCCCGWLLRLGGTEPGGTMPFGSASSSIDDVRHDRPAAAAGGLLNVGGGAADIAGGRLVGMIRMRSKVEAPAVSARGLAM